jgi:quercetin dioxygenase-like cupin family protein
MAMGLFVIGPQVYYPIHAHAAEELYLLLAGTVSFRINPEDEWQAKRAGDLVLHRSQEPHEMRTQRAASLALYIWRGEIFQPSWYKGDMSSPEEPPKYPDM